MSLLCRDTITLTALSTSSPHVALLKDRDVISALPALRSAILNCEDRCCCHVDDLAVSWSSEGAWSCSEAKAIFEKRQASLKRSGLTAPSDRFC